MKSGSTNENRGSVLLKPEENEHVFRLIGNRCQCLAAGVIQLYLTEPPSHHEWIKKSTGVITLIRDSTRRSFFLRLYCLQRKAMLWEHEVYNSMDYKSPLQYFHYFEGEYCMTAFNFAHDTDALILRNVLLEKLNAKRYRKNPEKRKTQSELPRESMTLPRKSQMSPMGMMAGSTGSLLNGSPSSLGLNKSGSSSFMSHSKKSRKKTKDIKLTKDQIGFPSNFIHVTHMGFNPHSKGLELECVDPSLKQIFEQAGISEKEIRDRETRKFIYDFIDHYRKQMQESGESLNDRVPSIDTQVSAASSRPNPEMPPPIPVRTIPVSTNSSSSYQTRSAPRLPPLHNQPAAPSAPPVHSRMLPARPPPPSNPPVSNLPPPPAPPPQPPVVSPRDYSPSGATSTAPPPPPPPLPILVDDNKSENNGNESQSSNLRSTLLDEIRSGACLKKVTREETKPAPVVDSRNDLLSQIRQGIELKSVANEPKTAPAAKPITRDGLAGALLRALAERSRAIHSDSEDSTSDTSNDDDGEWDD